MKKIIILALGKIKQNSEEAKMIASYLVRFKDLEVTIKELEIRNNLPPEKLKSEEGKLLLDFLPNNYYKIALDSTGKEFTSPDFSEKIFNINSNIAFMIGGAFGLSAEILKQSNLILSLSKMTWPHMIARALLVEQIYRAEMIFNNHPYHK